MAIYEHVTIPVT